MTILRTDTFLDRKIFREGRLCNPYQGPKRGGETGRGVLLAGRCGAGRDLFGAGRGGGKVRKDEAGRG
jgi:hypothetical protein